MHPTSRRRRSPGIQLVAPGSPLFAPECEIAAAKTDDAGGEFVAWECDTVLDALGSKANPIVGRPTKGLELNKWGYIVADHATPATNLSGVFAGGDIVTGGATVILARSAGRRAARAIATYLKGGGENWPPGAADIAAFVPPTPLAAETAL